KEDIYLPQFLNFLNSLLELSKVSNPEVANEAADSRKSISDYIKHVERRFKDISQGVQGDARLRIAKDFVLGDLNAVKDRAIEKTKQLAKLNNISLQEEVNQSQRMLSPSDFGLHNCIIKDDTVNFIDFEYFGWDDPAKLMADFFHHVNQVVSQDFKNKLLERFSSIQEDPKLFLTRFNIILHLVEMEWILIVLNVFSEGNLERRLFASPHKKAEEIILPRLEMAKTLVEKASF
ncbi:MAG: thiamine kinase-like enzyme, partial [Bacteriovoracaceae bacterium]